MRLIIFIIICINLCKYINKSEILALLYANQKSEFKQKYDYDDVQLQEIRKVKKKLFGIICLFRANIGYSKEDGIKFMMTAEHFVL